MICKCLSWLDKLYSIIRSCNVNVNWEITADVMDMVWTLHLKYLFIIVQLMYMTEITILTSYQLKHSI